MVRRRAPRSPCRSIAALRRFERSDVAFLSSWPGLLSGRPEAARCRFGWPGKPSHDERSARPLRPGELVRYARQPVTGSGWAMTGEAEYHDVRTVTFARIGQARGRRTAGDMPWPFAFLTKRRQGASVAATISRSATISLPRVSGPSSRETTKLTNAIVVKIIIGLAKPMPRSVAM